MNIQEDKDRRGFELFMENPYWRRVYENAPSENLKEYYKLVFDHNSFGSHDMNEDIRKR